MMKQFSWAGALLLIGGLFLMQSGCAAKPSPGAGAGDKSAAKDGADPAVKTPPPIASSMPGGAETPKTPGNGE